MPRYTSNAEYRYMQCVRCLAGDVAMTKQLWQSLLGKVVVSIVNHLENTSAAPTRTTARQPQTDSFHLGVATELRFTMFAPKLNARGSSLTGNVVEIADKTQH